jgi:DnaJ-class molecular chaperone
MSDKEIKWLPIGDRWLEKKQCDECDNKGFHIESITKECQKCDSIGYLETEGRDIVLCPKCLGMRQINAEKSRHA